MFPRHHAHTSATLSLYFPGVSISVLQLDCAPATLLEGRAILFGAVISNPLPVPAT